MKKKDFRFLIKLCCAYSAMAVVLVILLSLLLSLCSCASHKEYCGVTEEVGDSLSLIIEQRDSNVIEQRDSSRTASLTERMDSTHTESSYTEEETINEQITETTDSLGNKTTTTNRTTTKKKTGMEQSTAVDWQRQQEEWLAVHLSRLETLAQKYLQEEMNHKENRDSVSKEKVIDASPVWDRVIDLINYFVIGLGIGCLGTLAIRYFRGK